MTTMAKALTAKEAAVGIRADARVVEDHDRESVAKNLLLFCAAPWIGLGYIIAFPFVGFALLAKVAVSR